MQPVTILLAEDHALVRAGIRALLEQVAWVKEILEASTGREALSLVKLHNPDIVLMDIAMPEMNGLEATARIVQEFPGVRVIVLSMYAHEEYVSRALKTGVSGYLLKDAGVAELELAIMAVARGEIYLSPSVSRHVVEAYVQRRTREPTALERLTPRQREILQLVAEGHTTKEIAEQIHLSSKTVETYRTQLMDQLGLENMAGLIRFAIRSGIVSLDR